MSTNRDRLRTSRTAYQRYRRIQAYRHPEPVRAPLSLMVSIVLTLGCALFTVGLVLWATLGHQSFEVFLQWAGKAAGAL